MPKSTEVGPRISVVSVSGDEISLTLTFHSTPDDFERLADALRDLIAALEEPPSLGDAEARLLANLRRTLAEWEDE